MIDEPYRSVVGARKEEHYSTEVQGFLAEARALELAKAEEKRRKRRKAFWHFLTGVFEFPENQ
ncbi:MAG: hypothetical protein AB7F98_03970 [Novosphingobium sp.]